MMFGEGAGHGRKNFQNSVDRPPSLNGQDGDRTKAEAAADLDVDQPIVFSIVAMLTLAGAQAFAGNSSVRTQPRADGRRGMATPRPAHHGPVFPHRYRCT